MIHETPSTEIFNEMIETAKMVWISNYSNEYGYVTEKLKKLESIVNFKDNAMVGFRMFDSINQFKMLAKLSPEARKYITKNY